MIFTSVLVAMSIPPFVLARMKTVWATPGTSTSPGPSGAWLAMSFPLTEKREPAN